MDRKMSRGWRCSVVFKGCFDVVLLILFLLLISRCDSQARNESRIFKREALDGHLQNYLTSFGYMRQSADGVFAMRTEESIRGAIKEMQAFAGIPVTGKLDEKTAKLMRTPRCGLPDKEIGLTSGRRKRYAIHGMKWPHTDLTWSLRTKTLAPDLDPYAVRFVISKALAVWSKHSKLTFREVDSDRADILIYFYRKDHGDNFPFDGKGVILAHAFFPTGVRSPVDVHFDADENWTTSGDSEQGTNLFNVAAHEVGHSLGLSHSNVEGALMYPWYSEMKDGFEYELPEDDKLAIQYLYGFREEKRWERIPSYYPAAVPSTSTTTSTTTTTTTTTVNPTWKRGWKVPYSPRYPYEKPDKIPHKPYNPSAKKPHYHKPHPTDRCPHHKFHHTSSVHPATIKPTKTVQRRTHHQTHRTTTERPTSRYPKEYPRGRDSPPDTCDTSYDAVAVIRRELFVFKDKYFWRIGDNGVVTTGYPAEITRLFRGFPKNLTHVDAVFERADGNIVFFVEDKYYLFSGVSLVPGYPKSLLDLGLPSSVRKIDGAMIWGFNGKTYFFTGSDYYRFDDEEQEVEKDYPRSIDYMWKGIGSNIDAVFQWKDGKTYFFKGKGFWKFDDIHMRVEHYEQKASAPVWMGCKQDYEHNHLNQKLPYVTADSRASSGLIGTNIFIILFCTLKLIYLL
ncbi:matrix metalloproteinase-2-like [Euwallacea similis]|uniref:matrix metalloproteinase-2-like n=1 Tax=Euwallacea similis TaxID=1736056 RepID=UPI00344C69DF